MKVLKRILIVLYALVFLFGAFFAAYPIAHGFYVDYGIRKDAQNFLNTVTEPTDQTEPLPPNLIVPIETEPQREYSDLWDAMTTYNDRIFTENQSGLCDPWSYQQPSFQLEDYDLDDEVFGVITIPKLSLEMPIYLGATGEHMALGAAHLSQTSLPIGGKNTNCVIAGHRGYNGASYFRYVPDLQIGDDVMITNLWETLRYRVTEQKIIMPYDVDAIHIQPDKDMITLLTCHPYASGGRYRFLVFCERVEGSSVYVG